MVDNPPEEPLQFNGRPMYIPITELEQLLRACPSAVAFREGFFLNEADVDELLRAAQQLQGAQVYIDPNYPSSTDVSSRAIRLLQLAFDVQSRDHEQLVAEYNAMREELQDTGDRARQYQGELETLRALRDREGGIDGGIDLRAKNEELARRLDDEYRSNDRMRQQRERDERRIDDLEYRLQRADDDLKTRDDQIKELELQLRRTQEDYTDLRQTFESLRVEHATQEARQHIGDTSRQQEWKIERMVKENRALELQNVELRQQVQDTKAENLEVSEKIVLLDEEVRKLKAREADLEAVHDALTADKTALIATQEELRGELADKMSLLESFEARFQRQFRSWEEERSTLQSQIEALRADSQVAAGGLRRNKSLARGGRARASAGPNGELGGHPGDYDDDVDEVAELQAQLNEALEKEVLLLEAYEQLELSVAAEVDKALARQAEDLKSANRRVDFLTKRLDEERENSRALQDHQAHLEDQIKDALMRNQQYEGGIYGLPQAVEEIHQLKEAVYREQGRVRDCVSQVNVLSRKLEDLADENTALRKKAGIPEGDKIDISDVRLQKDATIAQLRSLNALLERQVADLEEERRKLRMEMKFRAKYHGQHALEMGLTPEQLLLVEQMVDDIKHGKSNEARLVDQLTHRIQFLEVRLGEVMAYADIPPSMRPALTEFDPLAGLAGHGQQQQALAGLLPSNGRAVFGSGNIRAAQLDAIKASLLKCLSTLRDLKAKRGASSTSDPDQDAAIQQLISQLTDTEQAVDAVRKSLSDGGGSGAVTQQPHPSRGGAAQPNAPAQQPFVAPTTPVRVAAPDTAYIADAMAEELRDKLRQLAKQVAELQSTVIQKDAIIQHLMGHKSELEKQFGMPLKDRKTDSVPRTDYEALQQESASLKEQLVSCLEELAAREREATDYAAVNARYQGRMQQYADQVKMLYREYAVALSAWKAEKLVLDKKVKKVQEDSDGFKAAAAEYSRGLEALQRGNTSDLQRELADNVRRMAIVQIKHAKVARELESVSLSERALQERVEELEQELTDVSTTCRSRMRWLETAAETARRRVDSLYREMQASVPLAAYQMLCEKHARQQGELRRIIEEGAQQVVSAEELLRLRDEMAGLLAKYDAVCDTNAELKERVRQLDVVANKSETSYDLKLAQELVASRVSADNAARRAQLAESERMRVQRTLEETQTRLKEVEDRLAEAASEVELLRSSRAAMEKRFAGAKTREEVDSLVKRLDAAETQAAEKHNDYTNLLHRAKDAEMKLEQAIRDRKRHLAQITNLRAALRDVASHREQASVVAKLHEQLDHALSKESLARNALNRSELHRFDADRELRKVQADLTVHVSRASAHQDQARWSDKQRLEAQSQLDISMAGRTEVWKAKLWSRKLQQLKVRNDALADSLDLARRRIKKLEAGFETAELKQGHVQEVASLLGKGVSEVVRDAARLHEQLLQLKLDRGKLQREEVMLREKVHYVERVNAEMHELIEKYEGEFFQQQLLLEADKAVALSQARELQDHVTALQERLAQLLAGKEQDGAAGKSLTNAQETRVGGDVAARLRAHLQVANAGDRDIMLKQIDSLHAARQEAEHLRHELHKLQDELAGQTQELSDVRRHHNDALARLKQQSEALLFALNHQKATSDGSMVDQIRAVAEATINELKERLKEKQAALDAADAGRAADKAAWLAQHKSDRAEIERLNHCLFKRNDESIANMKDVLSHIPRTDNEIGGAQLAQMRDALARATEDLAALRAHIADQESARQLLERNHASEVRVLMDEAEQLRAALDLAKTAKGPTKAQVDKLEASIRAKDDKLRQLRDAFKALEGKLIDAHKKMTDEHSKHVEELSTARKKSKDLEADKARLEKEVAGLKADLAKVQREFNTYMQTGLANAEDPHAASLAEQLRQATDKSQKLELELHRVRSQLQKYKNAERTVMDLTTGMSVEAKRQIDELQRRIHILEQQNKQLKKVQQADDLIGTAVAADTDVGSDTGHTDNYSRPGMAKRPTGRSRATDTLQGRDSNLTSNVEDVAGDEGAAALKTAAAVAQWEDNKRLTKQIDNLKKKLATRQEEVSASRSEAERRASQVAAMQKELDRQAAALRDMQEKLQQTQSRSQARPAEDNSKLQSYMEQLMAAESEIDNLRTQLARVQHQQQGAASRPSGVTLTGATDPLQRDGDMFELRLQRDQAVAQAKRLKERIADLFEEQALNTTSTRGQTSNTAGRTMTATSSGPAKRGQGGASGAKAGLSTASEAELLSTIANLKSALEKVTSTTTPTTKYMAEVQRRKDAQRDAAAAVQEAERLRAQAGTMQRMIADMQQQNADMRQQLRGMQEAATAGANAATAAAVAAATSQASQLELLLSKRDAELGSLRTKLTDTEQKLRGQQGSVGEAAALASELQQARARLQAVEQENDDLKAELNAFDPKFFDEIEDLKHEHYLLGAKVQEYESSILQLNAQLGKPPPPGLPYRLPTRA